MKNLNLSFISNIVLAVAVVVLFILHFTSKRTAGNEFSIASDSISAYMPIAYIDVDSLLTNYEFAKDANNKLLSKGESSRATLNQKARQLQNEMVEFQRKVQHNAFLSRERAEQEQARLIGKQQELEELDQKMTQELMLEQQKLNQQLRDTLDVFVKKYVEGKNIQVIFSNTLKDNILYSVEQYDITPDVVAQLNARYKKKK